MKYRRYAAYKESGVEWLGEVPAHWEISPIKYVASSNDDVLTEDTPGDFEIEYVEISGVDEVKGIVATETLQFANAPSRARRRVRDGDIIVSTVRTYLKAIASIEQPPDNLVVSTGFAVVRPRPGLLPRFASYLFKASYLVDEVIARSVGVSYPAINTSELVRIPAPIPSLQEQQAIVSFLDRETAQIDALIAKQEQLIAGLGEKRQALIAHAVTKGLNPAAPMKESGVEWLGDVPAHWKVGKLSYYAAVFNGTTPSRTNLDFWTDGTVPWLASGEVNNYFVTEASEHITEDARRSSGLVLAPKGSVIIGMIGQGKTRGTSAYLKIEACINQNLAALVPGKRLSGRFLHHVLVHAYEPIREYGRGGNQEALNCEIISSLLIPVPPLEEQIEIAKTLDSMIEQYEKLTDKANAMILLLRERRAALIAAAMTGKVDVRE